MIQIVSSVTAFSWLNICFLKSKLTDHDYILLSRGLKFIPNPKDKNAKLELIKDFDELARKMRCRYWFHKNSDKRHPCYKKKRDMNLNLVAIH